MLAGFFGVKEPEKPEELEHKIEKVVKAKVTRQEKEAWNAAGMPSPFDKWLAGYRKGHRT